MLLTSDDVQGGQVIGASIPAGYTAIERPIHPTNLQATILHVMGIDQHRLFYPRHNHREIVTVNGGKVVNDVFRQG